VGESGKKAHPATQDGWILPRIPGPAGVSVGMSTMFRGQFEHAIDAKGRTSLPSRFRDALTAANDLRFVLTRALPGDRCLHLYPMKAWEELEEKVAAMPQFDPNVVAFRRLYLSAAVECEVDKQGRVLIPPGLREHAELDKDVLWAGMGRTAELWAKEHWRAAQQMTEADLLTFKAAIAEQFRL
jgi:MraZ protein